MAQEDLLEIYEKMLLMRRFEEASAKAYRQGKIAGFCHLYIGQEAVAGGVFAALRETDYYMGAYRIHGPAIAKGLNINQLMAELYGKKDGIVKGNGGSMHFFDREKRFLGGHGIVGQQITLGVGVAFACKYKNTDDIVICSFGDGAVNEGAFHESLNLASIWNLPIIFICVNNRYGMGTKDERVMKDIDCSHKAEGYKIDLSDSFNDDDVLVVRDRMKKIVKKVREGKGPALVNIFTYRYRGHSMSDPAKYRTKEEVEEYKSKGPIKVTYEKLLKNGYSKEELEKLEESIEKKIEESVDFAEKSEQPPLGWLHKHVYTEDV